MKTIILWVMCLFVGNEYVMSQESEDEEFKKNRISLVLGHSYLNLGFELGNKDVLSIPSFGFDYEYWFKPKFGVGIFADIELISHKDAEQLHGGIIDREFPLVLTVDALWSPIKHLEFVFGPGVIFENGKVKDLIRVGLEYDLDLSHHWDVAPSLFYDHAADGISNISIGIGIGKRF
ncbi:hypothetical protein AXE80_12840 [Wenyingzhuangia fucanilytica]|uniref:Outer membrane protein beta-barrel domain-containing protein n=1 Tax=Wenyingzhuangia fucanilytica TaxID=1790137 RepID=A0A1B1Y8M6_9FLAO|nr:hypothetical protein [Wenyingzhuangia fucanilytica]ANW97116.1 hypothetical protein AXE80_12840 [Wenyingzhuangia fucanilytica]